MSTIEKERGSLKRYKKQKLIGTGGGGEVFLCVMDNEFC